MFCKNKEFTRSFYNPPRKKQTFLFRHVNNLPVLHLVGNSNLPTPFA